MKKLIIAFILIYFSSFKGMSQTVDVQLFKDGFSNPIDIQNSGDYRLFIVEQGGRIKIINTDGTVNSTLLGFKTLMQQGHLVFIYSKVQFFVRYLHPIILWK